MKSPLGTLTTAEAISYLRSWLRNAPEPQDGYYRLKDAIEVVVEDMEATNMLIKVGHGEGDAN